MYFLKPIRAYQTAHIGLGETHHIPAGTYWASAKEAFRWFSEDEVHRRGFRLLVVQRVDREKRHGKFVAATVRDFFGILNPTFAETSRITFQSLSENDRYRYLPLAVWADIPRHYRPDHMHVCQNVEYGRAFVDGFSLEDWSHDVKFKGFDNEDDVIREWWGSQGAMHRFAQEPGQRRRYTYRGYPCNIVADSRLWQVSGEDRVTGTGGILEWCTSEQDAVARWNMMLHTQEFSGLKFEKYEESL